MRKVIIISQRTETSYYNISLLLLYHISETIVEKKYNNLSDLWFFHNYISFCNTPYYIILFYNFILP